MGTDTLPAADGSTATLAASGVSDVKAPRVLLARRPGPVFETSMVMQGAAELLAYGTAVVVRDE